MSAQDYFYIIGSIGGVFSIFFSCFMMWQMYGVKKNATEIKDELQVWTDKIENGIVNFVAQNKFPKAIESSEVVCEHEYHYASQHEKSYCIKCGAIE